MYNLSTNDIDLETYFPENDVVQPTFPFTCNASHMTLNNKSSEAWKQLQC